MQLRVVNGGDQAFNALLYPPPDNNALNYFKNSMSVAREKLGNMAGSFMDKSREIYERFNSDQALMAAKMYIQSSGSHLNQNTIYPVSLDGYGEINLIMQRYVMSNLEVNNMYRKNMCDGFSNTFVDLEPGVYGTERSDYRAVMDGVVQVEDDEAFIMHYSVDEDKELDILDKISVMDTWNSVALVLAKGKDPTSEDLDTF